MFLRVQANNKLAHKMLVRVYFHSYPSKHAIMVISCLIVLRPVHSYIYYTKGEGINVKLVIMFLNTEKQIQCALRTISNIYINIFNQLYNKFRHVMNLNIAMGCHLLIEAKIFQL